MSLKNIQVIRMRKKKNIGTYRNIETNKRNYKPGSILFNTFENKLGMEHMISKYWRRVLDWILVNFLVQNLSWTRCMKV